MKKLVTIMAIMLLALTVFSVGNQVDKKKPIQGTPQPQLPPAKTPEQIAAEQKAKEEADLLLQIQSKQNSASELVPLIENFCLKFPDSRNMGYVRFMATLAYQQLNNIPKMIEHGQVAYQLLPSHPVIVVAMVSAYAENHDITKAEDMAGKAETVLNTMQKPDNITDEQWNQTLARLKNTLASSNGFVFIQKAAKFEKTDKANREPLLNKAIDFFTEAIKLSKTDDISYYRMGMACAMLNKVEESLNAYAKAVAINGPAKDLATKDLTNIIGAVKNDKSGKYKDLSVEGLVAKAKTDLGL